MRYMKRVSCIDVVGLGWFGQTMATSYDLDTYALKNIREWGTYEHREECYTRDAVSHWLMLNSGDFQAVADFRVTISDSDGNDFDSDFATEDGECVFNDCMYPTEAEAL